MNTPNPFQPFRFDPAMSLKEKQQALEKYLGTLRACSMGRHQFIPTRIYGKQQCMVCFLFAYCPNCFKGRPITSFLFLCPTCGKGASV